MNRTLQNTIAILLATFWIGLSEFVRNQLLFINTWKDHFNSLGLTFPSEPINGIIWMVWSLVFAVTIFFLSKKLSFVELVIISWIYGFVMMWLVLGNLLVLPSKILVFAVPLSVVEVVVANFIIYKLTGKKISK
jgi:hypothetical protein